jgi:uncharacterized phage-associated protein
MSGSVKAVANEFLDLAQRDRVSIDPLQMQKFVYQAQGWTLGLTGAPLFNEQIEAWEYGPVVPELYHSLKAYGAFPIRGRLMKFDYREERVVTARSDFDEIESEIIERVWKKYGRWNGPRLVALTHRRDAPWDRTRRNHPGENDARIPRDLMREWFEHEADEASLINQ